MALDTVNLLIVDDQLDNLRALAAILTEQGYKVRKALDSATALESAQTQPPDLILLDIKMPQMNGYEVCSVLKSLPHTCEIPIVFLSSMDGTAEKVRAFAVGGADYITKPFEAEEVLARVRQQLLLQSQKRQLQQEIRERQQAQTETQLLLSAIYSVSEASDFETALNAVLCKVIRTIGWDYGEAWTPTTDRSTFYLNQTCYNPQDLALQRFGDASRSFNFACGVGLPGRVWATQQPEWVVNVSESDSQFLRLHLVRAAGLKAAFAVPIVLNRQVLAVLAFFKRDCGESDPKLVQLVGAIALQLGGFMQRKLAEAALRQANQELQRLANIDGLTQVASRRRFDQVLWAEWQRLKREQAPLSLILGDIDFFKDYNDRYGHLAGDDCLRQVARALQQSVQRSTDVVARYGGEEFAIILPQTSTQGASGIAARVQSTLTSLNILHARSQVIQAVTLSLGVATTVPKPEFAPTDLIAAADRALYQAKAEGRNRFCFQQVAGFEVAGEPSSGGMLAGHSATAAPFVIVKP